MLRGVSLGNNSLGELPAGIFEKAVNLKDISLQYNSLTQLHSGTFEKNIKLARLRLSRNCLKSLPPHLFDNLPSLEKVSLASNYLTELPAEIFKKNTKLEELRLNRNQLISLPSHLFDNLGSLIYMRIGRNRLTSLPAHLFDNLGSLTFLSLSINFLRELPAGIFDKNINLKELRIASNEVSSLPPHLFDNLGSLTLLSMRRNSLSLDFRLCTFNIARYNIDDMSAFLVDSDVQTYLDSNLTTPFCSSSCENIPGEEQSCPPALKCTGTVSSYTCVELLPVQVTVQDTTMMPTTRPDRFSRAATTTSATAISVGLGLGVTLIFIITLAFLIPKPPERPAKATIATNDHATVNHIQTGPSQGYETTSSQTTSQTRSDSAVVKDNPYFFLEGSSNTAESCSSQKQQILNIAPYARPSLSSDQPPELPPMSPNHKRRSLAKMALNCSMLPDNVTAKQRGSTSVMARFSTTTCVSHDCVLQDLVSTCTALGGSECSLVNLPSPYAILQQENMYTAAAAAKNAMNMEIPPGNMGTPPGHMHMHRHSVFFDSREDSRDDDDDGQTGIYAKADESDLTPVFVMDSAPGNVLVPATADPSAAYERVLARASTQLSMVDGEHDDDEQPIYGNADESDLSPVSATSSAAMDSAAGSAPSDMIEADTDHDGYECPTNPAADSGLSTQ
ncbi:uncharacterized protein LOC135816619 [Sycon ciliatum]|uniref:uncharacterized protein LOC135816619 n=1 Tax=Sycon ciliatum TaxID=27933 RepID=UPI0031F71EA3